MKQKKWKIGTQQQKTFPVVNARIRPVDVDDTCASVTCQSLEFLSERPKAAFIVQPCMEPTEALAGFTQEEKGEILWEKAYREQKAGKEPSTFCYPMCAQCAAFTIMRFLGDEDEERASFTMAAAMKTGKDIILFDCNFSRERTNPALAVGVFETLADFRRHFWEHQK